MTTNQPSVEEMKAAFTEALNKFKPLRELEEEHIILTKRQTVEYMDLLENHLLPLRNQLTKAGEYHFIQLPENQFSFMI